MVESSKLTHSHAIGSWLKSYQREARAWQVMTMEKGTTDIPVHDHHGLTHTIMIRISYHKRTMLGCIRCAPCLFVTRCLFCMSTRPT